MKQKERLIAEQIYDNTIDVREEGVYLYMRTKEGWRWILFKPSQDAEQCLKLLEWLRKEANDLGNEFNELANDILFYTLEDWFLTDKDFKTAVFLAAVEYIKNKK